MSKFTTWKTQPIFISSTFTDMMAERDALRDFVFPELEAKLLERKTRLEAIDLRWGVETSDEKEQEEKELLVLKVCLDEIDRSLPFFIGIVGDRYGWIPPKERLETVEGEKGFKSEIKDKSVTALEIEYGVLANKEQLERSFFFFREPLPYDKIPKDSKASYADINIEGIDKEFARKRVEDFKKLIESKVGKDKVFTYSTEWDSKNNKVTGLDEFKQKVFKQLWKELDEQTKNEEDIRPKTWQDEERVYLDEFVDGRTISFSGRENIINKLKTFALAESGFDNWGLCLSGESGGGKSALFAKVFKELKSENDILVLGHAAGISLRSNSLSNMLTLWIEELAKELKKDISEQLKETLEFEDLKKLFSELLSQVAANKRIVILVDALNQFENTDHAKLVNWLPELIPANSKFIFTAITGQETENLSKREGIKIEELPPINKTDAEDIITIICNRYHKELNHQVINKLLDKKKEEGTPAYSNALWLTMAIDEFLLLDEDDFNRMKGLIGNAEQKLLQLLLNTAEELPPDIPGMYNYVFERAEIFGKEFVNSILSYIGISRNGLRESDLKEIINNYTDVQWEPLNFAAFRRYLRSHMVRKGEIGLWDFRHMQVRESLKNSLLIDEKKVKILHSNLAEHLEKLPKYDTLGLVEIIWHLFKCDSKIRVAKIFGYSYDDDETDIFSTTIKDILLENEDNTEWIASLVGLPQITDDVKSGIINNILFNLDDSIKDHIRINPRLIILKEVNKEAKQLADQNPNSTEYYRDLSITYNKIGDIYKVLGNNQSALESYNNALKIREKLRKKYPEKDQYASDSSVSYDRIGDIYYYQEELQSARNNYENSLIIRKELIKKNPSSLVNKRILSLSHARIGDIDMALDNINGAQSNYEEYLKITKELHELNPDSTLYTNDLSIANNKIGDVHLNNNNHQKAFDCYRSSLKIREDLVNRDPNSAQYARDLLVSYGRLGDAYKKQGDNKNTLDNYKDALRINMELNERFPESAAIKRDLFSSYFRIGLFHEELNDPKNALFYYNDSILTSIELRKLAPESSDFKKCLSYSYYKIIDCNKPEGDNNSILNKYENVLNIQKKLHNLFPESKEFAQDLSISYYNLGNTYKANGDTKDALDSFRNGIKIQEEILERNPQNDDIKTNLVKSYNETAIKELEKELETKMTNYETNPKDNDLKKSLAKSFEKLGIANQSVGNLDLSLKYFKLRNEIAEDFFKSDPLNANNAHELAASLYQLGSVYQRLEHIKDSVNHYAFSMKICEKLYADTGVEMYKTNSENIKQVLKKLNKQYPEI